MSTDETDLVERLHAVAAGFQMPSAPLADDVRRGRRRVHRNRGLVVGAVAAVVALVLGVTAVVDVRHRAEPAGPGPVKPPGIVVASVPVWYDAKGLHRGDVVERLPARFGRDGNTTPAALTLVRSGALYVDPARGDVWFHPWGGEPQVVGHKLGGNPMGDPNGDVAAWFEGGQNPTGDHVLPVELVVYDTAAGREISRTSEDPVGLGPLQQVSATRVAWTAFSGWGDTSFHDVRAKTTSVVKAPEQARNVRDVYDQVEVRSRPGAGVTVLGVPGRADQRYDDLVSEPQLSANGRYLLAGASPFPGLHAAIVDIRSGQRWEPKNVRIELDHANLAWSYGDVALWDTEHALLACDAARHTCQRLPAQRPFLLPTG